MGTIIITRKELYQMVWSEPITRLAQKFGFSDVWLARICRNNKIPRPPRGYWAIIKSGGKAPKTPLPKRKGNDLIEIRVYDPSVKKERSLSKQRIPTKKISKKIIIPTGQAEPHRLIADTERILISVNQDESGLLPPTDGCLDIRVSKYSLPRALGIMDVFIKILSNMGYSVIVADGATCVTIDGITLQMAMYEELDTRRRIRAADHSLEGRYEFGYDLYKKTLFPSGKLCFSIEDPNAENSKKKRWQDSDLTRIEDRYKEIVLALIRMAVRKKAALLAKESENPQGLKPI